MNVAFLAGPKHYCPSSLESELLCLSSYHSSSYFGLLCVGWLTVATFFYSISPVILSWMAGVSPKELNFTFCCYFIIRALYPHLLQTSLSWFCFLSPYRPSHWPCSPFPDWIKENRGLWTLEGTHLIWLSQNKGRNWSTEKASCLPKVTQHIVGGRARLKSSHIFLFINRWNMRISIFLNLLPHTHAC